MIIAERGSVLRLLAWQWQKVLAFTFAAAVTVALYEHADLKWLVLPAVPLAVAGGALGIFVSFRTNSAYDRWWEGRKLWGRMINTSRHISSQAVAYIPADHPDHAGMVRRHIAYVHSLRVLLRANKRRPQSAADSPNHPLEDENVLKYLTEEEKAQIANESNVTHALLHIQLERATALAKAGVIDDFKLQGFDESVRHLLDIQGGCERINKTPMPRGYGFIAERLIVAFGILFPLVVVAQLSWFTLPINVLVCLAFALISEAGRVLEDPFTEFWNGLPLMAISVTIERNLLHRLGEEAPPPVKPINDGVLM